jgi:hypothetical protein
MSHDKMNDRQTRDAIYEMHGIGEKKGFRLPVHTSGNIIQRKRLAMLKKDISAEVSVESKSKLMFNKEDLDYGKVCGTSPGSTVNKRKASNFTDCDSENLNPNKSFNFNLNYCKGKQKLKLPKIRKEAIIFNDDFDTK